MGMTRIRTISYGFGRTGSNPVGVESFVALYLGYGRSTFFPDQLSTHCFNVTCLLNDKESFNSNLKSILKG